jgi:nicotinamide mononucleotide (NMN) deamidase PncC
MHPATQIMLAAPQTAARMVSAVLQVAGADGSMANTVVGTPQYLPPGEAHAMT